MMKTVTNYSIKELEQNVGIKKDVRKIMRLFGDK